MKKAKKEEPAPAEQATIKTKKVKSGTLKKLVKNSDAKKAEEKPKAKAKGEKKAKREKGEPTERKVLYKYPKDIMDDADQKKNFRAKARKTVKGFDRTLKLIAKGKSKKNKAEVEKEQAAFMKATYHEA